MPWYGYHRYLTDFIRSNRCRRILEIGVYDGDNAVDMIKAASEVSPKDKVEYYGFDYFSNYSKTQVSNKLKPIGCKYHLFEGDTLETLPQAVENLPLMDLVFIDGGKSYAEAQSDWENSRRLLHDGSAVYVHNYEFDGVRRMVDGVSRSEYEVQFLREQYGELVAQIRLGVQP
jgi:predicted O-methyltransferase YrrM